MDSYAYSHTFYRMISVVAMYWSGAQVFTFRLQTFSWVNLKLHVCQYIDVGMKLDRWNYFRKLLLALNDNASQVGHYRLISLQTSLLIVSIHSSHGRTIPIKENYCVRYYSRELVAVSCLFLVRFLQWLVNDTVISLISYQSVPDIVRKCYFKQSSVRKRGSKKKKS